LAGDVMLEAALADERSSLCMFAMRTTPAPPKVSSRVVVELALAT